MKYDDATWHSGGTFPKNSPKEYGGTHIGLMLRYCLEQGWASEDLLDDFDVEITDTLSGRMSGTQFLFQVCDGAFTAADINAEGREFLDRYYGEKGLFLSDYSTHFAELLYTKPEQDHDFARFKAMIDERRASDQLEK